MVVENVKVAIFTMKRAVTLRFRCVHKDRKIAVYSLTSYFLLLLLQALNLF